MIAIYRTVDAPWPMLRLASRTSYGSPRVLLVLGSRGRWLKVLLPTRPNGATGWIQARRVLLRRTSLRVEVALREHTLSVFNGADLLVKARIATGADSTPTPRGLFYVTDVVRVPADTPWYGPYALGLSGFSPVLTNFAGGDGQVALHGTDHPELLGRSVSHGCIRLPNGLVSRLAALLPLGSPVKIS
jgi:lipoprotein-anchoring transpeptidase ErfK/SrfK